MATQSSSARSEARIGSLKLIRSKVCIQDTAAYFAQYDIPNSMTLAVPASNEAVFDHAGDRAPLYISHLEFGLRLPLHPFVKEVCEILGISPAQLTPNAVGMLMGFIVICYRVGVKPSLRIFSNLVSIKASPSDSHFYLAGCGGFKAISEAPVLRRDWRERFVWVIGADPIMACPTWPEFRADGLKPVILSADENRQLQKIKDYAGSRSSHNLFDPASLRVAGVAKSKPSEAEKVKAALLALPIPPRKRQEGTVTASSDAGASTRPLKRVRGFVGSQELEGLRQRASEIVGAFGGSRASPTARVEERRQDAGAGPSSADPLAADSPHEDLSVMGVMPSPERVNTTSVEQAPAREAAAEAALQTSSPGFVRRPGKEIAESSGARVAEAESQQPRVEMSASPAHSPIEDEWIPYPHRISDVPSDWWAEFHTKMVGNTGTYGPYEAAIPESNRFVAERALDKNHSILDSSIAQTRAVEQFSLPQDVQFLREAPTMGLHLALASYCVRGALIGQELYSRLCFTQQLPADFQKILDEERIARVKAEEKAAALQSELQTHEGRWRREVEIRDSQVRGLRQHRERQSAKIQELEERVGRQEGELGRQADRIKYLGEEVSLEKRHREVAQEEAHDARIALDNVKLDLGEERSLREAAQAAVQSLEVRLAEFDSQVYKAKVIEEYRESPLGKFEVALACKAGVDFLASKRPPGSRAVADNEYPPRVVACLDLIKEVEATGGGISLEVDMGDGLDGNQDEASPSTPS